MADEKIIDIDLSQISSFVERLNSAAQGDFKKELSLWMEGIGEDFLRIVTDEIERRKITDTRLLFDSFQRGDGNNVWVITEGGLRLEVGTNVEYAAYVNDGHWTCKKGEIGRFVPGTWSGDKFQYDPGAKTGMYLKQQWIDSKPYFNSAIIIMEKMVPELLEAKLEEWMGKYFSDFI